MKQIGGGSSFEERQLRNRRRAIKAGRLVPDPEDVPPITSDIHPAWVYTDNMTAKVNSGTKEIYALWDEILDKTEFRSRESFESAVEDARKATNRILTNMRADMFDFVGDPDEFPIEESGLWGLYEQAWKQGYAASGTETTRVRLTDVDRKWLATKHERLQNSLAHYQRTSTASSKSFANEVLSLPGGTRKDWKSPTTLEDRRRMSQALNQGYFDLLDEDGFRHGKLWNMRGIYGAEKLVTRNPSRGEVLTHFGVTSQKQLNALLPQSHVDEWIKANSQTHFRRIALDDYPNQFLRQGAAEAYNRGFLRGLAQAGRDKKKTLYVRVSDGPDCGWETHEDPKRADGLVVTIAEAQNHPIAHPYCRRVFYNTDEPPTKKAKKTQEKAQGKQKFTQNKAAKAAAAGGSAAVATYLGGAALRAAIANIPPILQSIRDDLVVHIEEWRKFQMLLGQAKVIMMDELRKPNSDASRVWQELYGSERLPKDTSILGLNRVRDMVERNIDEYFEREQTMSRWTRSALGLADDKVYASDELKDLVEDWADFAEYTRHRDTPLVELLERQLLTERAQQEFFGGGDGLAALRFHMTQPRGVNAGQISTQAAKAMLEFWKGRNIESLSDNIVLQLAEAINPFPVVKMDIGKVSVRLRVSVEGRRKIAEKLWVQHKGRLLERQLDDIVTAEDEARVISLELERIRKAWGGELPVVTKRDIIDAFLPRVTLNPGGIVSMTVARANGQVEWAGRFLGKGKMGWINLESKFRQSTMNRVIKGLRDGDLSKSEAVEILKEEAITDVNLFRNSPFAANMKLYGRELQSIAMKLVPHPSLGTIRNRYQIFSWKAPYKWEELSEADRAAGLKPVRRAEIIKQTDTEGVHTGNLTNVVVFPGRTTRLTWRRGLAREVPVLDEYGQKIRDEAGEVITEIYPPQSLTLLRFSYWRNSLVQVARDFRLDIDTVRQEIAHAKSRYANVIENISGDRIRSLRSWEEVKRYVQQIDQPDPRVRFQRVPPAHADVQIFTMNPDPKQYRAFYADADRVQGYLNQQFPAMEKVSFIITDAIEPGVFYDDEMKAVLVHPRIARRWDGEHTVLRQRSVETGHFPAGTDLPIASLYHEVAHHIIDNLSDRQYRMLWHDILETDARWWATQDGVGDKWDKINTDYIQSTIFDYDAVPSKRTVNQNIARLMGLEPGPDGWQAKVHHEDISRTYTRKSDGKLVTYTRKKGDPIVDSNRRRIEGDLSNYATKGPEELIAEALAQYMVAPEPGAIATTVGRTMENFGYQRALRATPRDLLESSLDTAAEKKFFEDAFSLFDFLKESGGKREVVLDEVVNGVERLVYKDHSQPNAPEYTVYRYQRGRMRFISDPLNKAQQEFEVDMPNIVKLADLVEEHLPVAADRGVRVWIGGPDVGKFAGMWNPNTGILSLAPDSLHENAAYNPYMKLEPLRKVFERLGVKPRFTWSTAPEQPGVRGLITMVHELAHVEHYLGMEQLGFVDDPLPYLKRLNDIYAKYGLISTSPSVEAHAGSLVRGNVASVAARILSDPDYDGTTMKALLTRTMNMEVVNRDEMSAVLAEAYERGLIETVFLNDEGIVPMATLVRVAKDGMGYDELFGSRGLKFLDGDAHIFYSGSDYGTTNLHEFIAEVFTAADQGYEPAIGVRDDLRQLFGDLINEGMSTSQGQRIMSTLLGNLPGVKSRPPLDLRPMELPEIRTYLKNLRTRQHEIGDLTEQFNRLLEDGAEHVEMVSDDGSNTFVMLKVPDNFGPGHDGYMFRMTGGRTEIQSQILTMEDMWGWTPAYGDDIVMEEVGVDIGDAHDTIMRLMTEIMPEFSESGVRLMSFNGESEAAMAYWDVLGGKFGVSGRITSPGWVEDGKDLTADLMAEPTGVEWSAVMRSMGYEPRHMWTDDAPTYEEHLRRLLVHETTHFRQDNMHYMLSLIGKEDARPFVTDLIDIHRRHNISTMRGKLHEAVYTRENKMDIQLNVLQQIQQSIIEEPGELDEITVGYVRVMQDPDALWADVNDAVMHFFGKGYIETPFIHPSRGAYTVDQVLEMFDTDPDDAAFVFGHTINGDTALRMSQSIYGATNYHEMLAEAVTANHVLGNTATGFAEDWLAFYDSLSEFAKKKVGPTLYRRLLELMTGTVRA